MLLRNYKRKQIKELKKMQIMNTFVAKIGPAGKRNRAARRKQDRILAYHAARGHQVSNVLTRAKNTVNEVLAKIKKHRKTVESVTDDVVNEDFGLAGTTPGILNVTAIAEVQAPLDFTVKWDENLARKALTLFAESGKSQRAFASEHGFSENRLRDWKKKLAVTV